MRDQTHIPENPLRLRNVTVAEVYLRLLKMRGIDYFFANAGTDFTPLIEAFAKGKAEANIGDQFPPAKKLRPAKLSHEKTRHTWRARLADGSSKGFQYTNEEDMVSKKQEALDYIASFSEK